MKFTLAWLKEHLDTAAALPEVACTVFSNVFMVGRLRKGETFLVHGGSGGIGSFSIQLASAVGARVATTAGSDERLERCRELGADITVNYKEQDFVEVLREATDGAGADGAGAELRQALGTAVFFGMIGVTGFGLLFTPTFYVVARALAMRFERRKPAPAQPTLQPAE